MHIYIFVDPDDHTYIQLHGFIYTHTSKLLTQNQRLKTLLYINHQALTLDQNSNPMIFMLCTLMKEPINHLRHSKNLSRHSYQCIRHSLCL